jgi:hypothetical protein
MLLDRCFLELILALLNWLVVAATFLELVAAAEWFESLETEEKLL